MTPSAPTRASRRSFTVSVSAEPGLAGASNIRGQVWKDSLDCYNLLREFPHPSVGISLPPTRPQTRAGQRPAQRPLSTRSMLRIDNLALAIDDDVDGIPVRLVHGGQIRVSRHHDVTFAGMLP